MQKLQVAFAGTNYEGFANLLISVFGDAGLPIASDTGAGPAPPPEKRPKLDLTAIEGLETSLVTSCEPILDKDDTLKTEGYYPTSAKNLHSTAVPTDKYAICRKPFGQDGPRAYLCPIGECTGRSSARIRVMAHIRRHLSVSLQCPYCPAVKFFSSDNWNKHMLQTHHDVPMFVSSPIAMGVRASDVGDHPLMPGDPEQGPMPSGSGDTLAALGGSGDN